MKVNFSKKEEVSERIRSVLHPTDYHNNFSRKTDTTFDLNRKQNRTDVSLLPASVLVPLQYENSMWQVILTRRSMNLKKHSGQISFPGGKFEDEDNSLDATALREAFEEIGIRPENVCLWGSLPSHETVTGFRVFPFIGVLKGYEIQINSAAEVSEVFKVPLQFLLDGRSYSEHFFTWNGEKRSYLAVPYGPYYIWGATARILNNFSEKFSM
tara:strand:- start:124 stop:759 length:636 start_codon:yes stop_codon:yes gene_type:complete